MGHGQFIDTLPNMIRTVNEFTVFFASQTHSLARSLIHSAINRPTVCVCVCVCVHARACVYLTCTFISLLVSGQHGEEQDTQKSEYTEETVQVQKTNMSFYMFNIPRLSGRIRCKLLINLLMKLNRFDNDQVGLFPRISVQLNYST